MRQLHTLSVWALMFQLHTSVTQKNRFRIICVIHVGPQGNKVPWRIGMLIYLPVTSRPLMSPQKEAVSLSPCNFATAHLTACMLTFYLPWTSRMKRTGAPKKFENKKFVFDLWPHALQTPPNSYKSLSGPSGPKCPGECPRECPRKPSERSRG